MGEKVVKYVAFKWPNDLSNEKAKELLGKKTDEFLKAFFDKHPEYTLIRTWDKASDEGYVFFFEVENNNVKQQEEKSSLILPRLH